MPVTYTLAKDRSIVYTVWSGTVGRDEWIAHLEALFADPEARSCCRGIVDLQDCTLDLQGEDVYYMCKFVIKPQLGKNKWRIAFVVSDAAKFGMARQFNAYAEEFVDAAIFHDYLEALDWVTAIPQNHPERRTSAPPA